jgi:hypothetical protein
MGSKVSNQFSDPLLNALFDGAPALLLTVGKDGYPRTAFTWVVSGNRKEVLFGADHGTVTLENLEREGRAAIQIILRENLVYLVKGPVKVVKERLQAAPFKMGAWVLDVKEVKDQSWPAVHVSPFEYTWSDDIRDEMLVMEKAVIEEMRACQG